MTTVATIKRESPKIEFEEYEDRTRLVFIIDGKDAEGRELIRGRIGEFINVHQSDKNVVRDAIQIGKERMHYFKKDDRDAIAKEVLSKLPSARK